MISLPSLVARGGDRPRPLASAVVQGDAVNAPPLLDTPQGGHLVWSGIVADQLQGPPRPPV